MGYSLNVSGLVERLKVVEAVVERSIAGVRLPTVRTVGAVKIFPDAVFEAQ